MNKYYFLYSDKATGKFLSFETAKSEKSIEDFSVLVNKYNEGNLNRHATLVIDPMIIKILDMKIISRERYLAEMRELAEEISNLSNHIEDKLEDINELDEKEN